MPSMHSSQLFVYPHDDEVRNKYFAAKDAEAAARKKLIICLNSRTCTYEDRDSVVERIQAVASFDRYLEEYSEAYAAFIVAKANYEASELKLHRIATAALTAALTLAERDGHVSDNMYNIIREAAGTAAIAAERAATAEAARSGETAPADARPRPRPRPRRIHKSLNNT